MIHVLIGLTGILLGIYAGLIYYYHRIWDSMPVPGPENIPAISPEAELSSVSDGISQNRNATIPIKVSVIIPARNEAISIRNCLHAVLRQSYPSELTEIIIVNDFSTDHTAAIVLEYKEKCRLLHLADYMPDSLNAYKKKAIETGIAHSSGELIICTDADCSMGPDWISTLVSRYTAENCPFMAAPVKIIPNSSALSVFQALDFISLQGITGASVYKNLYPMCNGANLAYTRKAFEEVEGFSDIDHIASGDDMLLMRKIMTRFPGKPVFLKDQRAIVSTGPAETLRRFFNQRIRWASKISHYKHAPTFLTLALVFLVNLCLLVLFISCIFYGHWRWLLFLVAFKTISEFFFVSKVAGFFGQKYLMRYFPLCQPFHIAYTVIAGSFGSFGKYEWKNRKVK